MDMRISIIIEIIAFLFIVLFLYAALTKLFEFEKFSIQVGQSPILTGIGTLLPVCVIVIEILVAALIIVPRSRLIGFFGAFILMTMFSSYIIVILRFSSYVPCSCGGVLEKLSWGQHLAFNLLFVVLALVGISLQAQQPADYETMNRN
jgi:uncharacterized membrane protein YphA (DoxX/SURF4 family)